MDWGTTAFRAYEVNADGKVINTATAPEGILTVQDQRFEETLESHIGTWDKSLPVVASGMITSRQGWVECAYTECPAQVSDLAQSITRKTTASGRTIHFITGLHYNSPTIEHDVLRGEETQVIGSLENGATQFITPGTHSKWISVNGGRIEAFATYMTGETYALYRNHSILGRLMKDGPQDEAAFMRGVAQSLQTPTDMLHQLFSVRTLGLFNEVPPEKLASYLSGLLIGYEVGSAIAGHRGGEQYLVLGSHALAANYVTALRRAGLNVALGDPLSGINGQRLIAKEAGIL